MRLAKFVRKASKEEVISGVNNIRRYHINDGKIIANSNPLLSNSRKPIWNHADATKAFRIPQNKINTFLAASSLSHTLDGWQYLSNAFNAILSGDEGTAIHLAYYAELRSAMSILATEGIGVFNDKHLGVFDDGSNCEYPSNYHKGIAPNVSYKQPKTPTHTFVWEAMEKWAGSAYKPNSDILKIFKVKNKDFYDLTEHFHPSTAVSTLLSVQTVKEWLKEWCFDIRLYKSDRDTRNEASYRPQRISGFETFVNFNNIINSLNSFWNVISPMNTDKYNLLDNYLLRKLFDSLYTSIGDNTLVRKDLIENAFSQVGINDNTLFDFLNFENPFNSDHLIFQQASIKKTTPLSIIARATLLLRISVGLVSQLYSAGGVTKSDLNFVWDNYGTDCGFWTNGTLPHDYNDLWSDVEPFFKDLQTEINAVGADNNLFSILQRNGTELYHLGQINRACLWGLDF